MSYKAEFLVDGKWYDNAIRLALWVEAEAYTRDKFMVWTMPSDWRVVASNEPVAHTYDNYKLERI